MGDVGVRELKQRLSEYLNRAERRNLARLLGEREAAAARESFIEDLGVLSIIELDAATCEAAAGIAELTGVRTLDAMHLAAARRVGGPDVPFVTFDVRQAQAA